MGIKKTVLKWAAIAGILATTVSCTADIDTFGTSDYRALNEISFEEQDGRPSISANEQRITVKLASNESCTWDSVTIDDLSISSLAAFHGLRFHRFLPQGFNRSGFIGTQGQLRQQKNQDWFQDRNSKERHALYRCRLGKRHSRPLANRLLEAHGSLRREIQQFRQGGRQGKIFFFGKG